MSSTSTTGTITEVLDQETQVFSDGSTQTTLLLEVSLSSGESIQVEQSIFDNLGTQFSIGDRVVVAVDTTAQGDFYTITDYVRWPGIVGLFLTFVLIVLTINRWHGLRSLLGLLASFVVIFGYTVPQLLAGQSPLLVTLLSGGFIIGSSYFLTHGFNPKTTIAAIGTFVSLMITISLSLIFTNLTRLNGFSSEEVAFLSTATGGTLDVTGLVTTSIVLGTLGVLDDITIAQASVVTELHSSDSNISPKQLFTKAMRVGHDHISSLVNTLILVYTSSALPTILLFVESQQGAWWQYLNYQPMAQELVTMLLASSGLVIAVPITTWLAVKWVGWGFVDKNTTHSHHHH